MTTKKKTTAKHGASKAHSSGSDQPVVHAATAASILGMASAGPKKKASNGRPKIKPEWAKYYQHLIELRERLLNQMSSPLI